MSSFEESGTRGVLAFEHFDAVPARVVLDSWFLRRAIDTTARGHGAAAAFLQRLDLVTADCFSNGLTELELIESAHAIGRPGLLAEWETIKSTTRVHWVGVDEVADDVEALVARYGLTASGAIQVATTIAVDADALVSVDPGLAVVDAATLSLLVDVDSVAAARRYRGQPS